MQYHQVPVKPTEYPPDLRPHNFGKKPLLPLPPPHMRKGQIPQESMFPVYNAPAPFVTYPREYYKKGIAPPPVETYFPTEPLPNYNGSTYSKHPVEGYHEFVRDDCPDKSKVDSSTQVDDNFSEGYIPDSEQGSGYKSRKNDHKPGNGYQPYSRQTKPKRQENQSGKHRSRDSQKKHQNGVHPSGYRKDENCKHQMNGSSSNGHDPYIDDRHDDISRPKHRRDDVPSHQQDNYSDPRNDDYSRQRKNGRVSHRSDDKAKHRRDDHSPRRQNSHSDHQSNNRYRNNRDSPSPNRQYKHSENRSDENFKHQRDNRSPHRIDIYADHRSDDKFLQRKKDHPSRRSDTYNDHRRDDKPNHHRNDNSTHRSTGHCDHHGNNCCKHQSDDYTSHRHNSDRRNNDSSKHRRKDQSSNRRDNSSDRRSDDSSKRRNGVHTDTSLDDNYNDRTEDFRDDYDFSTGDFYTYPNDKEIVSEDDQLYITTDSIGWPLESDSMSSRGSSSAGDLDCKVYVGQIGRGAVKEELEDKFGRFGRIKSVWIARNPPGFAFVVFYNIKDAEHAADEMDGEIINHRRARVEMSSGKSRWGSSGPPTRRRDSRDGRDSRRQNMYNGGGFSRSRSRSPPRYDRYRKYSRSRSRSKSPFENIYRDRR
ncbi:putative uncharacterized protein DDB_G0279653 [Pecten maximus]|uniref:putative uncharacterized protein DDB_G0279653 n=1 Tax=Pecten maximus TaxID=6579 RepID=UPI00145821EE|nr:putative uncharacterized protein DDB_G0279653 [Pecten maximus]